MYFNFRSDLQATELHLVGAGGTGSALVPRLAQLSVILEGLGHRGFRVHVWDDDTVSKFNVGRQVFFAPDVGRNKALTLVNRVNMSYGTNWIAHDSRFDSGAVRGNPVVIAAVDTRRSRAQINAWFQRSSSAVWIDCGNNETTGQVVVGARQAGKTVLPCVADLFPEIIDVAADADDDRPSCSMEESISRQDPMVNQLVAVEAANIFWRMLRFGGLDHQGAFIDAKEHRTTPMRADPAYWSSLGWPPAAKAKVTRQKTAEPVSGLAA